MLVIAAGLWFTGIIPWGHRATDIKIYSKPEEDDEYMVYDGMRFPLAQNVTVSMTDNGLIIERRTGYSIQLQHQDRTVEDFWENRDDMAERYRKSGCAYDYDAQRYTDDGRDYVRYSLIKQPIDSGQDETYMQIFLTPDGTDGRLFIGVIYDEEENMDDLSKMDRKEIYDRTALEIQALIDQAQKTDEPDDEPGRMLYSEKDMDEDQVYKGYDVCDYGKGTVRYGLPDGFMSGADEEQWTGVYKSWEKDIMLVISVYDYPSLSHQSDDGELKKLVDVFAREDHAYPGNCGDIDVNGRKFYYYSFFTHSWCADGTLLVEYNFNAYCNLGDGFVYSISGKSYTAPETMGIEMYKNCMHLE